MHQTNPYILSAACSSLNKNNDLSIVDAILTKAEAQPPTTPLIDALAKYTARHGDASNLIRTARSLGCYADSTWSAWRAVCQNRTAPTYGASVAIDATGSSVAPDVDTELIDVRALAPAIAVGEAAILAEARSLLDWHARHRFCAQCGSPTKVTSAGWVRRCPDCRASHFPRTDPVVIMLAIHGDRGLLGRNRRRAGARFSCLAGFVEPGETLEEAVRREVREESGIRCGRVRYLAAQPWPFPSSLMMGFLAEALTEEITVDPEELAEARWFSRDEIREMVARAAAGSDDSAQASLPAPIAIAHHICRRWSSGLDSL